MAGPTAAGTGELGISEVPVQLADGSARTVVLCFAPVTCSGRVTLKHPATGADLASAPFSARANGQATVKVPISKAVRSQLVRLGKVEVSAMGAGERPTPETVSRTLKVLTEEGGGGGGGRPRGDGCATPYKDPQRDTKDALDIRAVTTSYRNGKVRLRINMWSPFENSAIAFKVRAINVTFDARKPGSGPPRYSVTAQILGGKLSALMTIPGKLAKPVGVARPSQRSIAFSFPASLIGSPKRYYWNAVVHVGPTPGGRDADRAPNRCVASQKRG